MNDFWRSLKNAVDGALKTELEAHRDRGLCIGTVVLPRGDEIWCPEEATNGSWCDDHDPGEWAEDGEVDERYRYRGDRWSD